jgi:phosphonate transport system permease protein
MTASEREVVVRTVARGRERSGFVTSSAAALTALVVLAWTSEDFGAQDFFSEARLANVRRFASELMPLPLQAGHWSWSAASQWAGDLLAAKGLPGAAATLEISVAAIAFAALGAVFLAFPAARTFASPAVYLPSPRPPSRLARLGWTLGMWSARTSLIFLRAVPEYVWSFLLIAILGPTPWAAVAALALHNSGVLGKLYAEVVENLDPAIPGALRGLGASRTQLAAVAVLPAVAGRFLSFLFYRWETCVREATALGMLGVVSLGFFVQDARARQHYDVMFALIVTGAAIVLIGDFVSAAARELIRRCR